MEFFCLHAYNAFFVFPKEKNLVLTGFICSREKIISLKEGRSKIVKSSGNTQVVSGITMSHSIQVIFSVTMFHSCCSCSFLGVPDDDDGTYDVAHTRQKIMIKNPYILKVISEVVKLEQKSGQKSEHWSVPKVNSLLFLATLCFVFWKYIFEK